MRYRIWFSVVAVVLLLFAYSYADVPKMINFQGRLTDASGKFVTDGNYSLTFRIYSDSTGGSSKWSETQSVAVSKGLFNAILGSQIPVPDSIFNYTNTWLGIQVGADPEMTPRQRLTSLGYSYYALNSDKLDGLHASDFSSVGTDYGRSGVATDLYEGVTTLTNKYVNVVGPDSVYSTTGTAFSGKASGISGFSNLVGVSGYAENTSTGEAYGGDFLTSSSGTGFHTGVRGRGYGASTADMYGSSGYADNTSTGSAYGGYFSATSSGTGIHTGVRGRGYGASSSETYGVSGYASNSSTGAVYGGFFETTASGTGVHYGLRTEGYGSGGANTYGSYSYADNTSSGDTYAGYFATTSSGTGDHFGIRSSGLGASSSTSYGLYSTAQNTSSGNAYGGYFYTFSSGTGLHYGISTTCNGNSDSSTYGYYGYASNTSTGNAYGGWFETASSGTGYHYGVRIFSDASSSSAAYGLYSQTENTGTGSAYGGYFNVSSTGTGARYGVRSITNGNTGAGIYSLYGTAVNSSTGSTFGTYTLASNSSTGTAYGIYSTAQNTSTGQAYGGYFVAPGSTEAEVGIYARSWVAGYFDGIVEVTGNLYVGGGKYASVRVDNGEYRLLSCQESPEFWFEDFGEGQLVNGRTHIELDPLFLQTVTINSQHPMKVFVQLEGDCNGVYVSKGTTGFDVTELKTGTSNVSFSYRVVAKRKGFEDRRLAKMEGPTPEEMKAKSAKIEAEMERERARMEQENQAVESEK